MRRTVRFLRRNTKKRRTAERRKREEKRIKEWIVFLDSGDTLVDETTQVFDERGVVLRAQLIPGARELLEVLSLPRG